ncbi:MAG: ABC transporter permease subunit [Balneolia bacterium]|nr:ABC transporter permease subunit [Balneolia bacterium]
MTHHIFSFEWRHLKSSGLFRITLLLLPLLIGYSLYLGNERVKQQEDTIISLRAAEASFYEEKRQELVAIEQGEKEVKRWFQDPANPLVLSRFQGAGKHVFLKPKPLAALSGGQLDILPNYGRVTLTTTEPLRDNALENPFMQMVGIFDFAFVLVWLIPLFVIVLGYNMLSAERELGTWALLRSQPVSINRILAYKMLFRLLILCGLVILSLLLWSLLFGISLLHADGLALIGVILLYIGFWFALCALFNLFMTSSAVNAVGLAGFWVLFLLLIPSLISMLATSLHPVPSRALWITEQRSIEQAVDQENDALFDEWITDHPEEFVNENAPDFYEVWFRLLLVNEAVENRLAEAEQKFKEPGERQTELVSRLRPLSPPMWVQSWLERRAGTDAQRLRTLDHEMKAFQQEWYDFFVPRFRRLEFLTSDEYDLIPDPGL